MESNIFSTSSEGGHPRGGPTSKKRKLTMNKSENQYEAEIVKLKQEIQECQQELGKQIVKIARLEKEKDDSSCELDDIDMEETKAKEEEFKSKIALLQQQIEDERTTYETKLAEYKSTGSAQKIKELEVELEAKVYTQSSLRNTIEDIQKSNAEKEKILQNKINEMQSKCGDSDKKIKEETS
uniref:Uncharacterized protein n=1 Tax=Panagrolaimus superbus TaxID=310955 RepID=A0A914YYA8_9BILA